MDVKQFRNVVMPLIRILFPKGCSNRGRFLLDEGTFICDGLELKKILDILKRSLNVRDLTLHARIPFIRAEDMVNSRLNVTET